MSQILLLNQPFVFAGIGSFTYTAASAGPYSAMVQLTENPPTGLSLTVVNTTQSVTILTAPTITPTQIAQQFKVGFQAAANDVITISMTSSTPIDLQLNTVKWTATVQQGF